MKKPYTICHMLMSIDGKVTGDFLFQPSAEKHTEEYYRINRAFKADAFICGRITMEGSFTGGWYPDLTDYTAVSAKEDHVVKSTDNFYAVAFDRKGRLGWKSAVIEDEDPGYGGAQIIEVLTKAADGRYLRYLQEIGVSYIFAGDEEIDIPLALSKLYELFGIQRVLLEGGSVINGAFQKAGVIDELSLVLVPTVAGKDSNSLFYDCCIEEYELIETQTASCGVLWLRYRKKNGIDISFGKNNEIDSWMKLVHSVRHIFPGLETEEQIAEHKETVLNFMSQKQALCAKLNDEIVGVILFSKSRNMICCLGVSSEHRRCGAGSALLCEALNHLDRTREISVVTFCENDTKGTAPRALYRKFGFVEDEPVEKAGYPHQKFILKPKE